MLFRQRVSFQGASRLRRHICDEMAAYNAPTHTHHGDQSIHNPSLSLPAQCCAASSARRLALLPSCSPSRTTDYRWKRGQSVVFSGRAFSTKQADLNAQERVVLEVSPVSGTTGKASEQEATAGPFYRFNQPSEKCGIPAACEVQYVGEEGARSQSCHSVSAQTDHAVDSALSERSQATAPLTRPTNNQDAGRVDQNNMGPSLKLGMRLAPIKDSTTDDVTDTDYAPNSTDESGSQSEKGDSEADDDAAKRPTETHTPLDFQIPEDVLRAAMTAPANTKASFWSSNLYRGPEDKKILVHYCRSKEVAERVAQYFVGEKVVGFDIEWKQWAHPLSIKHNVSLIQLACENRIALFHVALFTEQTAARLMPPTLKAILESPEVYKVGVAVKGDFSRIVKFLGVQPQGVFELSRLHNLVEFSATEPGKVTNRLVGLAAQVQRHLQLPLYKGGELVDDLEDTYNVRSSDWSMPLNHQQIHYAAADAYAGFRLYDALEQKRKQLKPTPPRPPLCDYDSKPKPRPSGSKPRKKRTTVAKTDEAETSIEENASAPGNPDEEQGEQDEQSEVESNQSHDTEVYETAQEDMLDSHQLEGEDPALSGQSCDSMDESVDDVSIDSGQSSEQEETAASAARNQKRVGRINLSWLKGHDPGYPTLPKLPTREDPHTSPDEDLVDISGKPNEDKTHQISWPAETSEVDEETDEFGDSELEEVLQDMDIDSSGNLKHATVHRAKGEFHEDPEAQEAEMPVSAGTEIESDSENGEAVPDLQPITLAPNEEEQQLLDLLDDTNVFEELHTHARPPHSTDPSASLHTPEYELATAWAQSYLASTIPSPASRVPSHIRATIPHLRAYNMWHHQGLSLDEVARHLREPPLAENTVAGYVLQAITLEKMDFDKEKVKGVLMGMPHALRRGRWRTLAEKVGAR
ncbi:3'-5' exonuclease [Stagonosporopsis vannaccii]|nr:3'-5' exonuclease [Stagonosporopsis vannaccii]